MGQELAGVMSLKLLLSQFSCPWPSPSLSKAVHTADCEATEKPPAHLTGQKMKAQSTETPPARAKTTEPLPASTAHHDPIVHNTSTFSLKVLGKEEEGTLSATFWVVFTLGAFRHT